MDEDKVEEREELKSKGLTSQSNTNDATFDDVLRVMGEFGLYQKLIYLMFSLPYVVTAMQLMGWVFVGARYICL